MRKIMIPSLAALAMLGSMGIAMAQTGGGPGGTGGPGSTAGTGPGSEGPGGSPAAPGTGAIERCPDGTAKPVGGVCVGTRQTTTPQQ